MTRKSNKKPPSLSFAGLCNMCTTVPGVGIEMVGQTSRHLYKAIRSIIFILCVCGGVCFSRMIYPKTLNIARVNYSYFYF